MSQSPSNIGSFQSGSRAVIRTKTVYDANGRVVALIDDRGAQTTYQYDLLDRQTAMTFQDGSTRTSVYDLANDVTGYTDENGSAFVNTYDALGRRTATAITPATGVATTTTAQSFQYDGLSRLTQAIDGAGSATVEVDFNYDSLGRMVEESQKLASDTRYVTHSKFTSIPVSELTYPNTRKVSYGYDALYRRDNINETSGGASIAAWQFFGYRTALTALGNGLTCSFMNNAGNRSAIQAGLATPPWGDVTTDRLGYDGSGRMITKRFLPSSSTTSLVAFTTEYDPASNKLFERALHAESRSALYPSYDSINRLLEYQRGTLASGGESITAPIGLSGTDSQRSYDLDHLGNWKNTAYIPVTGSPATEVRRHNLVNEVTRFGTTPVLYDHGNNAASSDPLVKARGNGNIANDGTQQYQYDALNRLTKSTSIAESPVVVNYTYDALGRRIKKAGPSTFRYLNEGQQIVEVLNGSNVTTQQYAWGQYIDELVQLTTYSGDTPSPNYCLQDLLYRSIALTDSSGGIVEVYDYDAYGNTLIFNAAGSFGWFSDNDTVTTTPINPFLFTGRQYDPETGLYYYRARYYEPPLGRFLGRDRLIVDPTSGCSYVLSNPPIYLDPSGFAPVGVPGTPPNGTSRPAAPASPPAIAPTTKPATQPGPCVMTVATKLVIQILKDDSGFRELLCDAWKKTNPNNTPFEKKAEYGGTFAQNANGGVTYRSSSGAPGGAQATLRGIKGMIGTYHAHPDPIVGDPDLEGHEPAITLPWGPSSGYPPWGNDYSFYSPPSSPSNVFAPGRPNDITAAQQAGVPGIVMDRYYTYVYQGDGCTWKFQHPCVCFHRFQDIMPIGAPIRLG